MARVTGLMIVARVLAEPSGERIGVIGLAEYPANCAWEGADHQTMFFTANTSIYRLRVKTAAIPIPRASQASG